MNRRKLLNIFRTAAIFLLLGTGVSFAGTGELWESSVEMSGGNFPSGMPAQTQEVCLSKNRDTAPGIDDSTCKMLESNISGNKAHWKAKCQDGSTVTVDMTYEGKDAYKGTMRYEGNGMNMKMKLSGKRLGEECQLAEKPSSMPSNTSGSNQQCDAAVEKMMGGYFFGKYAVCKSRKKEFCNRLQHMSLDEYASTREQVEQENQPGVKENLKASGVVMTEDGIKGCGLSMEKLGTKACAQATAEEEYMFIAYNCPKQADKLRRERCEGRDYTSLRASNNSDLCYALGYDGKTGVKANSNNSSGSSSASSKASNVLERATDETTNQVIDDGIGKIKSLFKF